MSVGENVSSRPGDLTHMSYKIPLYPRGWRRVLWHVGNRWMGNRVLGWFAIWSEYEMTGRFVDAPEVMPGLDEWGESFCFSARFQPETIRKIR